MLLQQMIIIKAVSGSLLYHSTINTNVKYGLVIQLKYGHGPLYLTVFFIPISYIQSCVAYCEIEVDFGHIIGKENIVVVSPLAIYYCIGNN